MRSLLWRRPAWMARVLSLVLVAGLVHVPVVAALPKTAAQADEPKAEATEQKALAAAKRTGEPVEITSRRGETRTVRALPNGRIEVEERLQPIRARQGGKWVSIDTTLRRSGSEVVPAATTVGLKFSSGGDGPLVQMTRAGRTLALSWPKPLPSPTLDGDTAVYEGVAGPDVDLRLRAQADGFAHVLVVKSAEAAKKPLVTKLALAMSTTRLAVAEEQGSGVLKAADPGSGAVVFEAPSPVMWDSSQAKPAEGTAPPARARAKADPVEEPAEGAKTALVDVAVGNGKLTLTPDQALLTARDTVFPVYIDPVWTTNKASSWAMVSSGWPSQSYYKFAGNSTEGVGRCEVALDPNCVKNQTKRLFFRMPLPAVKGRYIQNVEFTAFETSAYNCDNPTGVQLWRTSTLVSHATWNNTVGTWGNGGAWGEHLTSREVAYCSRAPVEFGGANLRSHVQDAVNKGYGTITLGLKAYSESSMAWWKRFADDAYLRVQYNNPPHQPNTDSMFANPGSECVTASKATPVNDFPTVYAYLWDPDDEDKNKVRGQFTLHWANNADGSDWGEKWTSGLTPAKARGSKFEMPLPHTIPEGTLIGWGVRAWDGEQWGPWSYAGAQTGCYFYYDPAIPGDPTITSTDYPEDDAWHGGIGEPGIFTISDAKGVADRYVITLNGEEIQTVPTTAGAAQQVQIVPTRSGPNILSVQTLAPSNQNGGAESYEFRVNTGSDPVARFTMDEGAGSTAVASTGPGRPARLHGSATLGDAGRNGTALTLDGIDDYAESTLPIVDNSESFTVSVWAKPTQRKQGDLLAQAGTLQQGFNLGMQPDGEAIFEWPTLDNENGSPWQQAMDDVPLPLGQWSHLIGVYDKTAGQMRLYVNGDLQASANGVTPMRTHGPLQIGRSLYNGNFVAYWPGSIDDVQVFTQPLSDAQAQQLYGGTVAAGTGLVAHWNMDEAMGKSRVYSPAAPFTATVHNGAVLGAEGQADGALRLDNTAHQYAATERPVVNTLRSFTVSAWLKADGSATSPTRNFTAVSARGASKSGFYLKYVEETGRWVFARPAHDSAELGWYQATSRDPAQTDEWTHVVGVWDAVANRLRIYVNGEKGTDSAVVTSRWLATGGLEIGHSQWGGNAVDHWAGLIDDVRVYDRIVSKQEVEELLSQHPVLKARWVLNEEPVENQFKGPAGAPALTPHNGAAIVAGSGVGWAAPASLQLDAATKAFAESAASVMETHRSFTVTGWVYPLGRPQQPVTVFSQAGQNANAFALRYVPGADPAEQGSWQIEMRNSDDAGAEPITAVHGDFDPDDWQHVAIVYDALRDRVSLYVNGELYQTSEGVSQEGQVQSFETESAVLQVGRSKFGATDGSGTEFLSGAMDDLWVYQGALTREQVTRLAIFDDIPTEAGP
ncbi:LamG domain-containing protein [Actinomadura sp. 6K520]|uniref:LamG domain-containing protein n=1 Tax=Actinomadura sp. 6K520 TaxID=2530364 RepID=UPI001052963D|nr:LamG domain-containing protein [Actinomadura sp. 6K520]TDE21965.1 LamG domain-containing protein [Actinomadura sp. 6K520]